MSVSKPKTASLRNRVIAGHIAFIIGFALFLAANLYRDYVLREGSSLDHDLTTIGAAAVKAIEEQAESSSGSAAPLTSTERDVLVLKSLQTFFDSPRDNNEPDTIIRFRLVDAKGMERYRSQGIQGLDFNQPSNLSSPSPFEIENQDERWRVVSRTSSTGEFSVQVAMKRVLVTPVFRMLVLQYIAWPMAFFLPIVVISTWFAAIRGLKPLTHLATVIGERGDKDLTPLRGFKPYKETQPIIESINSLMRKLEYALTREREFVADAAHELRTPLAVVRAQAHLLQTAYDDTERRKAIQELELGVDRASTMVANLLTNARLNSETTTLKRAPIELTEFVQQRIASFSSLAARKKIDMELLAPGSFFSLGDKDLLASAIDNVLDNAIKYSFMAGKILVVLKKQETSCFLSVSDTGPGIAPELRTRVFERFYRIAGSDQVGTGLGLPIVRRIMELHLGEVSLTHGIAGRGLTVELLWPVSTT